MHRAVKVRLYPNNQQQEKLSQVENAAINIRAEGIRQIQTDGTAVSASGGTVRPKGGRKSVLRQEPMNDEAYAYTK
jgi:hypothetical protein